MNFREPRNSEEERISVEATEWLSKIDRELTPSEQDHYLEWLRSDPRHRDWIAMHEKSWGDFDLLSEWRPEHSEEPNPDLLATRKSMSRVAIIGSALALAASIAVVISIISGPVREASDNDGGRHIVATDYLYHELDDGSEIDLNAGSAVVVKYSESERLIHLVSGEAHFTVAKNPDRPFVVKTKGALVRAVGTAFNVRVAQNELEVLVTEGVVRMETGVASEFAGSPEFKDSPAAVDLGRGQRSTIMFGEGEPQAVVDLVELKDLEDLLSWKPVVFDFEGTPLSDAILQFNERNEKQLVLTDGSLADFPVVASFRSDNLEGFARLLELTAGLEIDDSQYNKIILRKAPGSSSSQ